MVKNSKYACLLRSAISEISKRILVPELVHHGSGGVLQRNPSPPRWSSLAQGLWGKKLPRSWVPALALGQEMGSRWMGRKPWAWGSSNESPPSPWDPDASCIRGNEEANGDSGNAQYPHPGEGSAGVSRCQNSSNCPL